MPFPLQYQHICTGNGNAVVQSLRIPKGLLSAWFPGAAVPLDISLQVEVDGHARGPRFDSRVTAAYKINRGLQAYAELAGCSITAFRRAAGPAALDLIVSSMQEQPTAGGVKQRGPRRMVEAADSEENTWPVVSGGIYGRGHRMGVVWT